MILSPLTQQEYQDALQIVRNLLIFHNLEVTHFHVQVSQEYMFLRESGSAFLSSAMLITTDCWYTNVVIQQISHRINLMYKNLNSADLEISQLWFSQAALSE